MKINLTKKQYERLIELVYLGDFIVNGYKDEEDEDEDYSELLQYIYSFSKEMGKENLIEYDAQYERYFETRDFDDEMMPLLEEYDEANFLDNFISKTTAIAFRKKYGDEAEKMSPDDFMNKMGDIREKIITYLDEEGFEKAIEELMDKI